MKRGGEGECRADITLCSNSVAGDSSAQSVRNSQISYRLSLCEGWGLRRVKGGWQRRGGGEASRRSKEYTLDLLN